MENKNRYKEILKSLVNNVWYIILLVTICTLIIVAITHWSSTQNILSRLVAVLMPFILGFFFSYLILPFVRFLQKQLNRIKKDRFLKIKKAISVTVAYIIIVGAIIIVIVYITPQIQASVKELGKSLQNGYNYLSNNRETLNKRIPFIHLGDVMNYIKTNYMDAITKYSDSIVPYIYEVSSSVLVTVYNIIIGIVVSIYIVLDSNHMVRGLKKIIYAVAPKRKEKAVWDTIIQCNHIFNGFLFGKAIDSLIIGILCFIAMTVLQLPYSLLLSLIVGITNMIPYFGPIFGAIPGVLIYLFIDPKLALIFAIMVLILQQFDGLYLGPKILGDLTGIKPLWVIFGVTFGGAYFGVMGMFLGVPAMAVIMYLVDLFSKRKLKKKGIHLPNA